LLKDIFFSRVYIRLQVIDKVEGAMFSDFSKQTLFTRKDVKKLCADSNIFLI